MLDPAAHTLEPSLRDADDQRFRHTPELLAPAGGFDQLEFALHFGADAVYLACDRFGLRQRAANFSLEDIPRAVDIARKASAKVYVTLNASLDDEDAAMLPAYLEALASAQVDAFIVSDLGAVRLARECAPEVAVHISTQASCMNHQAALAWYEMGARRIVCAREMSVDQIAAMKKQLPADLEIEVFVHGAMCMAISGRCLISDYLNGRSANRGHCTQPCRWGYSLTEETRPGMHFDVEEDGKASFIMSSKDLNMLHHLDDLKAAGVDSVKIEGRVKKLYYVATVVNAYRQVLDGADPGLFDRDLEAVSHRPYSTGFFYGPAEQAPDGPEYAQTHKLAAIVESSAPQLPTASPSESTSEQDIAAPDLAASGSAASTAVRDLLFDTRVTLYNRFFEGDRLEVLSPGQPVRFLDASDIRLIPTGEGGEEFTPVPVAVADQATKSYLISTPFQLQKRDILRIQVL